MQIGTDAVWRWIKLTAAVVSISATLGTFTSYVMYKAFTVNANTRGLARTNQIVDSLSVTTQEMAKLVAIHETRLNRQERDHERYDDMLYRRDRTSQDGALQSEDLVGDATPSGFDTFRRQLTSGDRQGG